jgi:ABC-type uncharacterized transport system permease subunit
MDGALIIAILNAAIISATPILYASLGEIFTERAGLLNLGVEGMMLIGAVTGFLTVTNTNSLLLGLLVAIISGALIGIVFAFLTVTLRANQTVTGLALTMFGTGFSGFIGKPVVGIPAPVTFPKISMPFLSNIPVLGPILFNHDILVYALYIIVPVAWIYIYRTTAGLNLRSVGENPGAVDAVGLNVAAMRYFYIAVGGAFAAVGGAYLSLAYAPAWLENMTAGRGYIAVALVIFATWNPARAMFGALLFGGVDVLGLRLQAIGITIPSFFIRMMPYIFTVIVLIFATGKIQSSHSLKPAAIGIPYDREER